MPDLPRRREGGRLLMWVDPIHGPLVSGDDLEAVVERMNDRLSVIVTGGTGDQVKRALAEEIRAMLRAPTEPAVLVTAGHEAGPGFMDLWARALKHTGASSQTVDRVFKVVDDAVTWQARHGTVAA